MSITYKVADGFDVVLGSMTDISPQPRTEPIRPTRRSFPASGVPIDEGDYVEFIWAVMTETQYQSILTQFGLSGSATSNEVTVYVNDGTFTAVRKNGLAIRPIVGDGLVRDGYQVRDVIILVRNLEDAA